MTHDEAAMLLVLPASAGMILWLTGRGLSALCAPRIRGDDPLVSVITIDAQRCSPHPRG